MSVLTHLNAASPLVIMQCKDRPDRRLIISKSQIDPLLVIVGILRWMYYDIRDIKGMVNSLTIPQLERQGADMQSKVDELEALNHTMRDRDKLMML